MANMLDHVTCAYIDCTLKLEDYGPTQQYASEVEDNLKIFGNKGNWVEHVCDTDFLCLIPHVYM